MGLIGRRCTAVMPSRPVLIGRGLVPTTYKTTHTTVWVRDTRAHNEPGHEACSRPLRSSQPTTPHGGVGFGKQINYIELGNTPTGLMRGCVCFRQSYGGHSERETPGPIPNPEVKPFSADGTAAERLWESRTPPDIHSVEATARWPLRYFRGTS